MEESRLKALAPFAELTVAERKMLARTLDEDALRAMLGGRS